MNAPIVQIYDIMAHNVYMDFENIGLRAEQHKFLVSFFPTGGRPVPELVERITARGPGGYEVNLANQEYTAANLNGYIYDRTTNAHWYMVNLQTGFMRNGVYEIEVQCKDGSVKSKARRHKNGPSDALVATYLRNRERIYRSHTPGNTQRLQAGGPLTNLKVKWSSLRELAQFDAFYIYRVSEGRSSKEFNTQKLVWWDNIFVQAGSRPDAGRNRNSVTVTAQLKPDTSYVYFTEITDSNAMGETNISIFQPHQTFRT
jgi:hypothetical protein